MIFGGCGLGRSLRFELRLVLQFESLRLPKFKINGNGSSTNPRLFSSDEILPLTQIKASVLMRRN
jgi:hypothetical protein